MARAQTGGQGGDRGVARGRWGRATGIRGGSEVGGSDIQKALVTSERGGETRSKVGTAGRQGRQRLWGSRRSRRGGRGLHGGPRPVGSDALNVGPSPGLSPSAGLPAPEACAAGHQGVRRQLPVLPSPQASPPATDVFTCPPCRSLVRDPRAHPVLRCSPQQPPSLPALVSCLTSLF